MTPAEYEARFPIIPVDSTDLFLRETETHYGEFHRFTVTSRGFIHGLYRIYVDGNLVYECTYRHGMKHGRCVEWNLSNGVLLRDMTYRYNMLHGVVSEYDTEGLEQADVTPRMLQNFLAIRAEYNKGRLHGPLLRRNIYTGEEWVAQYSRGAQVIQRPVSAGAVHKGISRSYM